MQSNIKLRDLIRQYYWEKKECTETKKLINEIHGEGTVTTYKINDFYNKFEKDDESRKKNLKVKELSMRNDDKVCILMENNPYCTAKDIAEITGMSQSHITRILNNFGYIYKFNCWIKNELSEDNLSDRRVICKMHLERNINDPFLTRMIAVSEKCVHYKLCISAGSNTTQPCNSQTEFHRKKANVCIFWDTKGLIYCKLLSDKITIDADTYCSYLDELKIQIREKRPELDNGQTIMFYHNSLYVTESEKVQEKMSEFGWEFMRSVPNSFDLEPSTSLFETLYVFIGKKYLVSFNALEECVLHFCSKKSDTDWSTAISSLPEKWQKVLDNDGKYVM